MSWPHRVKKDLLEKLGSLKMIQSLAAGVDGLDFADIPHRVRVFSNAGSYTDSVAEHAWGLLLGVAKGVHARKTRTVPRKLRGKKLLIVGCGAIGSGVAGLARSLEMRTMGVSRSFKVPGNFDEMHPLSYLDEALAAADAIVVALPLTKGTRGLLGEVALSKTKEGAILVNVGRGETVDEHALVSWLRKRPESRYATDVFWTAKGRETFDTEAWELLNFAGTLHISGLPQGETLASAKFQAAKNVSLFLEGRVARNEVDKTEYF